MRGTGLGLSVLAVAALAVTGLSSAVPASAAAHHGSRTIAAVHQVPHPKKGFIKPVPRAKAAWQAAIRRVRTPRRGCFHASYPALAWHAVKCHTAPKWPFAPAQPAGHARAATVAGNGPDYVAQINGSINQATGSFFDVSSGITEQGLV